MSGVLSAPALDTLSNAISVLSQQVSVVSQSLSSQAAALSVRIDTQSQGISVLSQQVSVLSQSLSSQAAALSVRIDTQSQAVSVLSQGISVVSQALSSQAAALSVRIDTQSQAVSVLSQQLSALSQAHSVLSQAVSVMSNTISALSVKTVGPAFSGYTTSTLIPPGAPTKVKIDTEEIDTDSAFDSVTNFRFNPQVAGRYLMMASTALVLDGAGTRTLVVYLYKNGASVGQNTMITALNVGLGIQAHALVSLNGTTDYMEMFVYHDNTLSTLTNGYPQTQFAGAFVR